MTLFSLNGHVFNSLVKILQIFLFKKGGVPRMGMGANPKECNLSNPWR
jgi:hypothetical protein